MRLLEVKVGPERQTLHVALFSVCIGSLVLGLPLAWNVLWHLKESKLRLVDFAFIYQIDFEYIGGILYL